MKRAVNVSVLLMVAGLLWLGCESADQKAQKLYNAGRYEEVVAKYGNDAAAAPVVQQAKDKIAERWYTEGRYQMVMDTFPASPSARESRNRMAAQWLSQKRYQDVVDKFPDTPAAAQARAELAKGNDSTRLANSSGTEEPRDKPGNLAGSKEGAAQTEYKRITAIKIADLRVKALREFIMKPEYSGTAAQRKAQQDLRAK